MYKLSLRAARVNADLSAEEAAAKMGVSTYLLRKWERDPASIPSGEIGKIKDAYNVPIDLLFFGA